MEGQSTVPLLNGSGDDEGDYDELTNFGMRKSLFIKETGRLWKVAFPIVFQLVCLYGLNSSTQIFIGHVGNVELAAVAIGLSVISSFSFGFLYGMASALETLCGQAFGSGQVHKLGVYMQRSWIILLVCGVIVTPLYVFATPILRLIGQEEEIATMAGEFTIAIIPQIFASCLMFPVQKCLQAQRKVNVLAWISLAALILHVLLLTLFVYFLEWSVIGAAIVTDISQWFTAIAQIVYVFGWCKDSWKGFSMAAFDDLWPFIKLSLASAVMLCFEIWYMMVLIVLTGNLSNPEIALDSISICMNVSGWEVIFFIGLNAAIGVRVSNELGSGHPRAAKFAVFTCVFQSLLIGLCCMAVVLIARNQFAVLFTSSTEVQTSVAQLAYLLGITMVLNSVQPVLSGVAVGGGWQALVAYINLGCYYVFGLPLGFLLGYTFNLGVEGIWAGMLCGTGLQTLILLVIVWRTNWQKEVDAASTRIRTWGGHAEENQQV